MFVDKNSIEVKVGNGSFINIGQYLTEAKYGYNKLWSSDSGRNLAGVQSGTLIGIFVKIIVQFRALTKAELEILAPILDSPRQTLRYYDANKKAYVEMETYTGDYEVSNKNIIGGDVKNEPFQISFIATSRRV